MQGFDVVVIGAGIQGLSAAANIAKRGSKRVVVIETENASMTKSSSKTAAMLMLQRENPTKIALSLYSYLEFLDFKRQFGSSVGFRRTGFLMLATPSSEPGVLKYAELRRELGVRTEILEGSQVSQIDPNVDLNGLTCAVYGPDDGVFSVPDIAGGYLNTLGSHEGELLTETRAVGLELKGSRATGVRTSTGTVIDCDWVVNAAGSDAPEVGKWVGDDLRIESLRRTLFRYRPLGLFDPQGPLVEDAEEEFYYRGDGDSIIFGLGRERTASTTPDLSVEELSQQWARAQDCASKRFPSLRVDNWETYKSGFRQLTPDITPLLGRSGRIENLIHSCGWGGEGVQHSPAGGRFVADLVYESKHSYFDPTALDPSRQFGQR